MSLWKKNLSYFIVMLIILFIIDIFENNSGMWLYNLIIWVTIIIILITYIMSSRFKKDISKIYSFASAHKFLSLGLIIAFTFALFKILSSTLFHEVQPGQVYYKAGEILFGCKICTGWSLFSGGGCSINIIPNCFLKFLIFFIGYAFIAVIVGLIIDWIIGKIKKIC